MNPERDNELRWRIAELVLIGEIERARRLATQYALERDAAMTIPEVVAALRA